MPISPNMNLPIPVPSQTGGPQYAQDEVSCFNQIDSHNHTTGQGSPIPVAALLVNSNLSMNSLSVTNLESLQLLNNAISPGTGALYMQNDDLYWSPGNGGASVQMTIGSTIAGAPGNITNLVAPASAVFDGPSSSFIFQSNVNTAAGMDHGPLTIRNTTVSSNGITINAPNPLPSNYSYTLPNANPSSNSVLVVDNAGVMSYISTTFLLPAGSIIPFAGTVAPAGWLFCQGQTLDSVANPQYANLFAVIGTTYGGTGAASFNVPDLRGRVGVGAGNGPGLTPRNLSDIGGQEDLENHSHSAGNIVALQGSLGVTTIGTRGLYVSTAAYNSNQGYDYQGANPITQSMTNGIATQGESATVSQSRSQKNMQPFLVLNYIIKF